MASVAWVSDNGLRVVARSHQSIALRWDPQPLPVHLQMKKGVEWGTVYRGYREEWKVGDLAPNALFHFRMRCGEEGVWGSEISGATESLPAYAEDLQRAVQCNAEDMVVRILGTCNAIRLRRLLGTVNMSGHTPLMIAACNRNVEIVRTLLRAGADVNQRTGTTQRTALMLAASAGDIYVLSELHAAGADWTAKDATGSTAIHYAVNGDALSSVRFGLAKCGASLLEQRDAKGWTPLLRSLIVGSDARVVETLLKAGANANAVDGGREKSCLIVTALLGKDVEARLLLKFGADPTFRNRNGMGAYDLALSLRNKSVAETVLGAIKQLRPAKIQTSQ